jgi:hypothetical protein
MVEKGFCLLQELQCDCVLLPFLELLSDAYGTGTSFRRSSSNREELVQSLIAAMNLLREFYISKRDLKLQRDVSQHINLLTRNAKTAKHRLTPRLEHLADYQLLRACPSHPEDAVEEYCWQITEGGSSAVTFLKRIFDEEDSDNAADSWKKHLPIMREFFFKHAMSFVAASKTDPPYPKKDRTTTDILETFCYAYSKCSVQYGYSEFFSLAIIAGLFALERGIIIDIESYYRFFREDVPNDADLSRWIRLSSRVEPEALHIRIHKEVLNKVVRG